MPRFDLDNSDLEVVLRKIETLLYEHGGWAKEALVIKSRQGDLWLESTLDPGREEPLIFLPDPLLLPLDEFVIETKNRTLALDKASPKVTPYQKDLMALMLEVFNITKKLQFHYENLPWLAFDNDPEILTWFRKGRPDFDYYQEFMDFAETGDRETFAKTSFLRTRYIDLPDKEKRLMPFIDFANHHFKASVFVLDDEVGPAPNISLWDSRPLQGSNQCFAKYGNYDAFDMYLNYSFPDDSAPFVRSVPVTIDLEDLGQLVVGASLGFETEKTLPPQIAGLEFYFPKIESREKGRFEVTHLIFPGPRAPNALRRILGFLIRAMDPKLSPDELLKYGKMAERQMWSRNIDFYRGFLKVLQNYPERPEIKTSLGHTKALCEIQLRRLEGYKPL